MGQGAIRTDDGLMAASNSQFAEAVGCTVSAASRLRNGMRKPSLAMMIRIARAYNIEMEDMAKAVEESTETFGRLLRERVFEAGR